MGDSAGSDQGKLDDITLEHQCESNYDCDYVAGKTLYPVIINGRRLLFCSECTTRYTEEVEAQIQADREVRLRQQRHERSGIPNIFKDIRVEDFKVDRGWLKEHGYVKKEIHAMQIVREQVLRLYEALLSGEQEAAAFIGNNGTGKSMLACGMINGMNDRGYESRFYSAKPLLSKLAQYENWDEMEEIGRCALAVIDDFTNVPDTEYTRRVLASITEQVHGNGHSLIITSNKNKKNFEKLVPGGVYDRLVESANGGFIEFEWASFRPHLFRKSDAKS